MKLLEDKIRLCGKIGAGDVLKVDNFLNHRIDVPFLRLLGEEFYYRYQDCAVNKILTIEASGIGIACLTAQFFDCPVVFAKKSKTSNLSGDVYASKVFSYTHQVTNDVIVNKAFLESGDRVLIIDDFLANGQALMALRDLCEQAGATVVGAGIVIEKAYQPGGSKLRAEGLRIESLARVASMSVEDGFTFIPDGR